MCKSNYSKENWIDAYTYELVTTTLWSRENKWIVRRARWCRGHIRKRKGFRPTTWIHKFETETEREVFEAQDEVT